jgi:hypothetical protein
MDGFLFQYLSRFVDFDTSLCCRSAFHGLKIHCGKWNELDTLLRGNDIHRMFEFAYRNGSVKLAKYCLLVGRIDQSEMNRGLHNACRTYEGKELAELMISKGATDWNIGLHFACEGGCKELAELMISKGATDWNIGLRHACFGGHKELAELMILKGANDWNSGLQLTCLGGCKELAELMILKGANDWNPGLHYACFGGRRELIKLMISHGASNCNNCHKSMQSHLN